MLRRFIKNTGGAAAAEMALIAPLAVLIMFTAIETGHYYYERHQVVKGLRDGARFAARNSFDDINCRGGSGSIAPALETQVKNLTRTGELSGGIARIRYWQASDVNVSVSCPGAAEASTGIFASREDAPQVNVSTDFTYTSLFGGLGIINDTFPLKGTQQAVVMGI